MKGSNEAGATSPPGFPGVLDGLPVPLAIVDGQGELLFANRAWRRFAHAQAPPADPGHWVGAGVAQGNYLAACEAAAAGHATAAEAAAGLRTVLGGAGAGFALEYCWDLAAGRRWFLLRVDRLAPDDAGDGCAVITHEEITARRQAEQAVRDSEARYRLLFDLAPAPLWLVEAGGEGYRATANQAAAQLFGYDDAAALEAVPPERVSPPTQPDGSASAARAQALIALAQERGVLQCRWRYRRRDGSAFDAEVRLRRLPADGSGAVLAILHDLSGEREQDQRRRLAAAVFEHVAEALLVTDPRGDIVAVNPAFTRITGYRADEVLGRNPRLLRSGRQDATFYRQMWQRLAETGHWQGELWNRRKDGSLYPLWMSIDSIRDESGACLHYAAIATDLTDARRSAAEVEYLHLHDPLTGLPNARLLRQRLAAAVGKPAGRTNPLALIDVDIDRFQDVVASHGHAAGDALLRETARRIGELLPADATAARLSDDTFGLLIRADGPAASQLAARLQRRCSEPLTAPRLAGLRITVSVGIALHPDDASDAEELLRVAASALLQAKRSGRQAVAFDRPEITERATRRLHLEGALRDALRRGELELVFQPIVEAATGALASAEALLRWRRGGELLPPSAFIDIVEDSDLVHPIGRWVLESALTRIRAWAAAGLPVVPVLVNAAEPQISAGSLARDLRELLAGDAEIARLLGIEVIERALLRDPEQACAELQRVRAQGVGVALDDFGTGYSSLGYLSRFPVDRVKIDRSFVQAMARDSGAAAVVRATLSIARDLGIRVVAEGIETEAELRLLAREGCDLLQGFLISRPLAAEDFERLLAAAGPLPWQRLFSPNALGLPGHDLLVLSADPEARARLSAWLAEHGWRALVPDDLHAAFEFAASIDIPVVLIDRRVPGGGDGVEIAMRLRSLYPAMRRLLVVVPADHRGMLEAVNRGGAFGLVEQPIPGEPLRGLLETAYQARREWRWPS